LTGLPKIEPSQSIGSAPAHTMSEDSNNAEDGSVSDDDDDDDVKRKHNKHDLTVREESHTNTHTHTHTNTNNAKNGDDKDTQSIKHIEEVDTKLPKDFKQQQSTVGNNTHTHTHTQNDTHDVSECKSDNTTNTVTPPTHKKVSKLKEGHVQEENQSQKSKETKGDECGNKNIDKSMTYHFIPYHTIA